MTLVEKNLNSYSAVLVAVMLSACATDMTVPVMVAAGEDIRMERLAVYPVKDSRTREENFEATRELESLFVNAEVKGKSVFDVIAISELGTIQDQKNIEMQAFKGSFDQSTVSALQARGVEGLVIAYLDEVASNESSRLKIDGKEINCKTRKLTSVFHPKIVSAADARIVVQRSYSGEASKTACDDTTFDSSIDVDLAREARGDALGEIRRDIAPYTRNLKAAILTNFCADGGAGKIDEVFGEILKGSRCDESQPPQRVITLVKNGAVNIKGGRLDKACEQWAEAASIHSDGFIVPYLLGICAEVEQNNLSEAHAFYQQADAQARVPVDAIREAMTRLDLKNDEKSIQTRKSEQRPVRPPNVDVLAAQHALAGAGYDPGPADGYLGDKTTEALHSFQEDHGLETSGRVDADTRRALGF